MCMTSKEEITASTHSGICFEDGKEASQNHSLALAEIVSFLFAFQLLFGDDPQMASIKFRSGLYLLKTSWSIWRRSRLLHLA